MAFNPCMHERNIYKVRPDFHKIAVDFPQFRKYAIHDEKGRIRVDFNDTEALRTVTKVLLKKDFGLEIEIPNGFLIPTVPQRLNYILWVEDLLTLFPKKTEPVFGIDIGTGPCAIFSLLGSKKNEWHFLSTETSEEAKQWAEKNIKNNELQPLIKVMKVGEDSVLEEVMALNDSNYSFCLCNPPFFENIEEIRKKNSRTSETIDKIARKNEILFEGGEVAFVKKMIKDSQLYKERISLYTSMFGKKKSFIQILKELQNIKNITYTQTQFCQGNTIRWGVAWTYLKSVDFKKIQMPKPMKNKKVKPPLVHTMPKTAVDGSINTVEKISKKIQQILRELEILLRLVKSAENYAEIQVTTDRNTWSHQRRKRREMLKMKGAEDGSTAAQDSLSHSSARIADAENSTEKPKDGDTSTPGSEATVTFPVDASAPPAELGVSKPSDASAASGSQVTAEANLKRRRDSSDEEVGHKRAHLQNTSSETRPPVMSLERKLDANPGTPGSETAVPDATDGPKLPGDLPDAPRVVEEPSGASVASTEVNLKHKRDSGGDENGDEEARHKRAHLRSTSSETQPPCISRKRKLDVVSGTTAKTFKSLSESADNSFDAATSPEGESSSRSRQSGGDFDAELDASFKEEDFEPKSLLYATLKLRKGHKDVTLEMNCPPENNRESMHQVFQYLKNKLL